MSVYVNAIHETVCFMGTDICVYHAPSFPTKFPDLFTLLTTNLTGVGEVKPDLLKNIVKSIEKKGVCNPPADTRWILDEKACEVPVTSVVNSRYVHTSSRRAHTRSFGNQPPPEVVSGSLQEADLLLVGYDVASGDIVGFASIKVDRVTKKRAKLTEPFFLYTDVLCGSAASKSVKGGDFLNKAEEIATMLGIKEMRLRALDYMVGTEQQCKELVQAKQRSEDPYSKGIKTLVGYYKEKHKYQEVPGKNQGGTEILMNKIVP